MDFTLLRKFWKPIAVLVLVIGSFLGGWKANEVYHGYKENLEARIEKKFDEGLSKIQAQGAQNLIDTQELLKKNKAEIIEKEVPIIIERKVYQNPSLDQDGVEVLRKLKEESAKKRTK
ncbi:hypothetical protein ENKO_181 [Klebsiella phage fENko-Kae01]|nr:hypothetical protein [Klebsiella phage fENko-Kae01]